MPASFEDLLAEHARAQADEERPKGLAQSFMRERRQTQIRGVTWEIEQVPPRLGYRTLNQLVVMLGPEVVVGLFEALKTIKLVELVEMGVDVAKNHLLELVLPKIAQAISALDPDQNLEIADALLVGQCLVQPGSAEAAIPIDSKQQLDQFVPDVFSLIKLVGVALDLNFLPISAADVIAAVGGQDTTKAENPSDPIPPTSGP